MLAGLPRQVPRQLSCERQPGEETLPRGTIHVYFAKHISTAWLSVVAHDLESLETPADSRSVLPVLMSELAIQVALFSRNDPPPDEPHKHRGQQQRPHEPKPARDAHVQEQHSHVHRIPGEPIRTMDDKHRRWPHRDHTRPGGPEAPHARGRERNRGESEHRSYQSS